MLIRHLSTQARAALAALALALGTVSTGAYAFPSVVPDPFLGQTVDLQATPPGTWVGLPGLGYTRSFLISGFTGPAVNGDVFSYSASFQALLSDTIDGPVVRTANLTGTNNFVVQFVGRNNPYSFGEYDMILQTANFSGTVDGQVVDVSLANIPNGRIRMTGSIGNAEITYITAFSIDGQYRLDGGDPIEVPGLGDVNGQPPVVPVPGTAALAIPGLLVMAALRRRRAAVAA